MSSIYGPPFLRSKSELPRRSPRGQRATIARSAPTEIDAPVNYPTTPVSVFLPISVELFPGDHPPNISPPTTPSPSGPTYDDAIARLDELVSDSTLKATQRHLLEAIVNTAQMFVPTGKVHSLLTTIGSAATPASYILSLVNTTTLGMRSFAAPPAPNGSSTLSVKRNDLLRDACASRDRSTCVVTGRRVGECCHLIPFSANGTKAEDFWALVAMFKGQAGMQQVRRMTLGPRAFSTDNILNVLWLSSEVHKALDDGQLALVPLVSAAPYDPATVKEVSSPSYPCLQATIDIHQYSARVELPYGADAVDLCIWTTDAAGRRDVSVLRSGQTITLRTAEPTTHPLPHPLLLQLHTAFTRLRKMCATAGVPLFPINFPPCDNGEDKALPDTSDLFYQDLVSNDGMPLFPENDDDGQVLPGSLGLPLKERFLELLCGSQDSQHQQYTRVMDSWAATVQDMLMPHAPRQQLSHKLEVELVHREAGSASDGGRLPMPDSVRKRSWRGQWNRFGLVAPAFDTVSE